LTTTSGSKKDKWLDEADSATSLSELICLALEQRLQRVENLLTQVAGSDDPEPEDVHQLRVWSRRATAVFDLFADSIPRRQRTRWRRRLRKIRRAATEARELDVLDHQLAVNEPDSLELVKGHLRELRATARAALIERARRTQVDRLVCRREKLLKKVSCSGRKSDRRTFAHAAPKLLRRAAQPFFRAAQGALQEIEQLHQFRIAAKRLRYAMELLASAFDASFRDRLYPQIEELQERLGQINDLAQAAERFEYWATLQTDQQVTSHLRNLASQNRQRLESARADFGRDWNSERAEYLRDNFAHYSGEATDNRASS